MLVPPWLTVLDETIEACAARQRVDLVHQLRQKRAHLLEPTVRVLVVGEAKQGKSQLVNALINASVCAVGDDITTMVPTVIQHAEEPTAALVKNLATAAPQAIASAPVATERVAIPIEQVATKANGQAAAVHGSIGRAEVGIPRALLAAGLILIDTPAMGYPHSARTADTFAALSQTDLVLMTSEATRELSATELGILQHVTRLCPNVVVVLTKIDICPQWRLVTERSRAQIAAAGITAPVMPVSATLRLRAASTNDKALNTESGFPDLVGHLQRDVITKSDVLARRSAAAAVGIAIEQLVLPLHAELSEHEPGPSPAAVSELQDAQRRVDALRRHSTRWQTTLADEMGDLASDVEYDLRDRTRQILKEIDRIFDTTDPVSIWESFESWLTEELLEAAWANYNWLIERSQWISRKIANNFPIHEEDIPEDFFEGPEDMSDRVAPFDRPDLERFTVIQKLFSGLRGSYGGLLMFGLVTSLAGMPLINPISLSAGVAFGTKTVRDEASARLKSRQAVAKGAAQRLVDDFFIKCSKECKDTARHVHGMLRDHFSTVMEDLQNSIVDSARVVKENAQADATERDRRRHETMQQLERLAALHKRAQILAANPSALPSTRLEITA